MRDAGLRVSNVVELGWWDLGDAVDVARAAGAVALRGGRRGGARRVPRAHDRPRAPHGVGRRRGAARRRARPRRALAEGSGVPVTVEHTGALRVDLSFLTTFRDGVDLARGLGVGLCMEVSSCFAERDLATSIAAAADVLAHVQLSDFVVGSLCTPDRAVPGDGDIALDRIIGWVVASGYGGMFELELVGPRVEEEGYAARSAGALRTSTRSWISRARR